MASVQAYQPSCGAFHIMQPRYVINLSVIDANEYNYQLTSYAFPRMDACLPVTASLLFVLSQGSIYIPKDIMTENNLDLNTFRMGPSSPEQSKALKDCVFEMASQAYGHLDKARALNYTGRSTYALLPAVRASMFLEKLRKADFDIYDSDLHDESSPLRLQMNLLYTSIRKKI